MSAELLVTLNTVYLVLMGVVAVVGTATLAKLMLVLLREKPGHKPRLELEPEDA